MHMCQRRRCSVVGNIGSEKADVIVIVADGSVTARMLSAGGYVPINIDERLIASG